MIIILENGGLMIETEEISTLFVADGDEIFFNGWVKTGEPEPEDWTCANLFEGKFNYVE